MTQPSDKAVDVALKSNPHEEDQERLGISLALSHLSVHYGGVYALHDISFSIEPGERVGILGNNGSGKSTLCNVITGLTNPSEGVVYLDGNDITKTSALKRAHKGMRYAFQHPALFSDLSLEENVIVGSPASQGDGLFASMFFPRMHYKNRRTTARQIMDYCNITEDISTPVANLSYATQKRVELARALMGNPRVLVLDEPAASMSEEERAHYCQVVLDYVETFKTTLVVVEHDIDFVRSLCQRAIVLDAGEIVADGTVIDVLHNDKVKDVYLDEGAAP